MCSMWQKRLWINLAKLAVTQLSSEIQISLYTRPGLNHWPSKSFLRNTLVMWGAKSRFSRLLLSAVNDPPNITVHSSISNLAYLGFSRFHGTRITVLRMSEWVVGNGLFGYIRASCYNNLKFHSSFQVRWAGTPRHRSLVANRSNWRREVGSLSRVIISVNRF